MTMTPDRIASEASTVLAAVEGGTLAFTDLLRTVSKREDDTATLPVDLPKSVVATSEQLTALASLPSTVAVAVTPTERRRLEADELVALMDERGLLDAVAKLIEDRKEAQRAALFNHFDVEAESTGQTGERDKKGHLLAKAEVVVPGSGKKFTREVRSGSPTLTAEALEAVAQDDSVAGFDHDDYIACTTQVRVVDEAKVLLHLRKKPSIITALAAATQPGSTTAALYVRKG